MCYSHTTHSSALKCDCDKIHENWSRKNRFYKIFLYIWSVYSTEAGFYRSRLIDSKHISHYIPFLPLEKQHLKSCIRVEAAKVGVPSLSEETMAAIIEELEFWPNDTQKYAVKGCKNVREKVYLHASKHRPSTGKDEL